MISPNNYPVILCLKIVLIIIFTNIYSNIYKDTKSSFFQENNDRKSYADSAEIILKIANDSTILRSYQNYKSILKVQKSVVDNIYNKLKNSNSKAFSNMTLERPEHRSTAFVYSLHQNQYYGDTIAKIIDTVNNRVFYTIFRETRQTFALGYKQQKIKIGNLETAINHTAKAIDFD